MNARNTKPAERQRPRGRREAIQHRQYLGRPRLARTFSRQRGQYLSCACKVPKGRAQPGAERRRREEAGCDNLYGRGVLFSLCQTERRRVQIDLSARCRYACFSNISAPTAPCSRIDLHFPCVYHARLAPIVVRYLLWHQGRLLSSYHFGFHLPHRSNSTGLC